MSKDRYSDNHIIEVLQDNDLTVSAEEVFIYGNGQNTKIELIAGDINIEAAGAGDIKIEAAGAGDINIEAAAGDVAIAGFNKVNLECADFGMTIKLEEDGIDIESAGYVNLHGLADGLSPDGADKWNYGTHVENGIYADYIFCDNFSLGGATNNDIVDWSDIESDDFGFNITDTGGGFTIEASDPSTQFYSKFDLDANNIDILSNHHLKILAGREMGLSSVLTMHSEYGVYIDAGQAPGASGVNIGYIKIGTGEAGDFNAEVSGFAYGSEYDFGGIRTSTVEIAAESSVLLDCNGSTLTVSGNGVDFVTAANSTMTVGVSMFHVTGSNSDNVGHVCLMTNSGTGNQADVLKLQIGKSTPENGNTWLRLTSGNATASPRDGGTTRGRIRGANTDSTYFLQSAGGSVAYDVGVAGDAVFESQSSDFGEWFEVGDPLEWTDNEALEGIREANRFYFGIPGGTVVYVRDRKLYKNSPGIPMVVTYRALLVGNYKESNENNNDWFGQILSFVGQIPVIVNGSAATGDLLVPSGEGHCISISEDDITFKQYINSIGRALESKEEDALGLVWCAIGIK